MKNVCKKMSGYFFMTLRGSSSPKVAGFCTLYGLVGYCRLSDGSDPVYQRPFALNAETERNAPSSRPH